MNLNDKNIDLLLKLERFFFLFTLFIMPISKAGLNISISFIILSYLARVIFSGEFRFFILKNNIFKLMVFVFALGVVSSFLSGSWRVSLSEYARHYIFLILAPYFVFFFQNRKSWRMSVVLLSLGMLIGGLFSYWNVIHVSVLDINTRVSSFWDISRWGEFIVYFMLLIFPYGEASKRHWIIFLCISLFMIFPLLWTGSRAPLLMLILLVGGWTLSQVRNWKISIIAALAIAFSILIWLSPNIFDVVVLRLESIANIKDNYSNIARLYMWKYALLFQLDNMENNLGLFLFGTGYHQLDVYFTPFIENTIGVDLLNGRLNGQFSFRDHHNIFLNAFSMHGILFFCAYIIFLWVVFFKSFKAALFHTLSWAFVFVFTAYLGVGFFFGISGGYSAIFVSIVLALAYHMPLELKNITK
ncbi:O-antigen ligase family protein [Vibrio stylophorae]|nr:hypothetical protein [Vibrio stylophorae]